MVVEVVPIESGPKIADGAQMVGEELHSQGQPVGGGEREVQPHLGEIEAAPR